SAIPSTPPDDGSTRPDPSSRPARTRAPTDSPRPERLRRGWRTSARGGWPSLTLRLLSQRNATSEPRGLRRRTSKLSCWRGTHELRAPESLHAPAVCCSAWFGVHCSLGLGCHVRPQGFASYFAVSAGFFRCHVRKEGVVLCLPLVSQRRWAETLLEP